VVSRPHHSGRRIAATVTCPECSAIVGASRLKRHLSRVHKDLILGPSEPARAGPLLGATSRQLVICHYCKASVRSDRLEKHVSKMHSESIAERPKPAMSAPPSPAIWPRTTSRSSPETSSIARPTRPVSRVVATAIRFLARARSCKTFFVMRCRTTRLCVQAAGRRSVALGD
jgi:hypothetical protein